jgi:hypothetical protein
MFYKQRHLNRLWEVEIINEDDPAEPPRKETLIAWNAVGAIRNTGKPVARQPAALFFVTYPDAEGNIYRIDSPREGPTGDPVTPSIQAAHPG